MRGFLYFILTALSLNSFAGQEDAHLYTVNLSNVVSDRVEVIVIPPSVSEDTLVFYMPKIIPGTYDISDFGRFVTDFKAVNREGDELKVIHDEVNTWKIPESNRVTSLSYWVDDTFDADMGNQIIDGMGGTNIADGQNYVLNNAGFFGYVRGKEHLPAELRVVRPKNLYGSSAVVASEKDINPRKSDEFKMYPGSSRVDIFKMTNYHELVDSPIMYNIPDTTSVFIDETQVLISVYSPGNNVQSDFVAETIESLLIAQRDYLGGKLPVDKYAFLFYFEDISTIAEVQGALEHNYSSFYYLPDVDQESMEQSLRDIAAHEFFHIVTPLGVHSEEIEFFDFNNPKMSKHLWLYEGVTEYFAGHSQAMYELITMEEYLEMLRMNLIMSTTQYDENLPFTDLSQYVLDKHPDQYQNVYLKGALIGLCLDIKLRHYSEGKYGLRDLLADLTKRYGRSKPFKDDELFGIIEELTFPQIGEFLRTYIAGPTPLPYSEIFDMVGVNHWPYKKTETFTLGNFSLALEGTKLVIDDVSRLNQFGRNLGYKSGDVLLAFQGNRIPDNPYQISQFIENILGSMIEGEEFTVLVSRKNSAGEMEEVELKALAQKFEAYAIHVLEVNENATEQQEQLRKSWIKPQNP